MLKQLIFYTDSYIVLTPFNIIWKFIHLLESYVKNRKLSILSL